MKCKFRSLFSLLVLTACTIITLTCCATLLRRGLTSFDLETTAFLRHLPPPSPAPPVFNSTLLKQAEIQIGEAKFKKEIDQLLAGDLGSLRTHRTFATWRRFSAVRVRAPNGLPLTLRSPVFYRYWLDFRKNLSEWARKKRFRSEVLSDLVSSIKHPLDKHFGLNNNKKNENQNKKYSSCAVVGNSGILLNNEYGEEIDQHEIVIRLNNARIDNYKAKVGSKTNISFINSNILHLCARRQGCFCHPYGKNVPIIMYICQPLHFLDYSICNSSEKPPLIVTDPSFDVMCSRVVKYYSLKRFMDVEDEEGVEKKNKTLEAWSHAHEGSMFHYSSGMQAIMMSIGICEKVSLYGFGKSSSAKHHYHTNQKVELSLHDYEAEYDFYHDLMKRPNGIPFFPKEFKVPPVVLYR